MGENAPRPGSDGQQLLEAAAAGDRDALEAIFHELQPRLLRYFRAYLAPQDTEDAAADVWTALLPRLETLHGGLDGLRALAFTIARRLVIGEWRRRSRRPVTLVDQELLAAFSAPDDPASCAAAAVDANRAVAVITAVLPPDQAEVVLLRVVADLDTASVAAITGQREGTVRVMLHRALRRLAEALPEGVVTR